MHGPFSISLGLNKNAPVTKGHWAERLNWVSHRAAGISWILHLTSQEAKFIPLTYSTAFCWIWMPAWVYLMRHRKALRQWTRTAKTELPTALHVDRPQVSPSPWYQVCRSGDDTFRHQTQKQSKKKNIKWVMNRPKKFGTIQDTASFKISLLSMQIEQICGVLISDCEVVFCSRASSYSGQKHRCVFCIKSTGVAMASQTCSCKKVEAVCLTELWNKMTENVSNGSFLVFRFKQKVKCSWIFLLVSFFAFNLLTKTTLLKWNLKGVRNHKTNRINFHESK